MANKAGKGGFGDHPQHRNTEGAPRLGESWKELYKRIGGMSGQEAAEYCMMLAKDARQLKGVTLKEAVALRVFVSLLNEPTPGLLTAVMDRDEGKVKDESEVLNVDYSQLTDDQLKRIRNGESLRAVLSGKR